MGLERWISKWKQRPDRKLNLAQKILWNHALSEDGEYMKLMPDRVAMQDASAQMAILQFMLAKKERTAVPSSIHCDHLIKAEKGADVDLAKAIKDEDEIFNFLQNAAEKYGISFWKPGSGIIHQIVLENYATPGGLMLGTDSHTPNAGGLGMLAIGVGGADAVDAMVGIPWELKRPKVMGIHLHGKLSGWASPKDVILTIAEKLTVQGGTHYILEYFGDGIDSLSCTGMATICNMGAEVGATSSLFPFTMAMSNYLRMNGRGNVADLAGVAHQKGLLSADANADYDQIIDIDLNRLEPRINGPFSPDISTTISQFKHRVHEKGWKDQVAAGLIGSCTNSSYEDMSKCSDIIRQAEEKGLKPKSQFLVTPGSEQIRATIERDGYINSFQSAGAEILSNACGPCIGQWKRDSQAEENAILTSFNRNFRGRNDGQAKTMNFLASPEIVTAMVYSGKLSFNPITDYLELKDGSKFRFQPPRSMELPASGFEKGRPDLQPLESQPNRNIEVTIDQNSSRLQLLDPFEAWDGKEFSNLRVLVKIVGKCTTDHISAAGPWLKYKGHLDNIANNTLIGAQNAFNGKINWVKNEFTNTVWFIILNYRKIQSQT
jgi:aconitate hydratase